jgi:hypothetical protein
VRFRTCTMCPDDPFGTSTMTPDDPFGTDRIPDHKKSWLFIEQQALDRFINSQPFASPPPGIDYHLSPYLRVMHLVAEKLDVTPENQPKKAVVRWELESTWKGPELPDYLLKAMATCVREYESTKGKNNKTGSEGKRQIPSGAFHLSPYLRALHTVAKQLQISPDNQPTVDAIGDALEAAWSGPEPLSPTFRKRMALLLREPFSGSTNKIKRAKRLTNRPKK